MRVQFDRESPTETLSALIVEPVPAIARLLAEMVENCGFKVLRATDLDGALDQAEQATTGIDLLITEIGLSGLSGPAIAAFFRARCPNLPVLLLCDEYVPAELKLNSKAMFLAKPFTQEQLTAAIAALTR